MALSPEQNIQKAFDKVSIAIQELEATIRDTYDTPSENIASEQFQKIRFPSSYIRSKYHFVNDYKLISLIPDKQHRDSIAYSLMLSDLHNYFINRVQVWGIIKKLLLKGAIINLVSVIEGLLMCSIGNLHSHCRISSSVICKNQSRCTFYVKSSKNLKVAGAVQILHKQLMLDDDSILEDITTIYDIRNNVHLLILQQHEFTNDDYSIINYNKAIRVLQYLKANLPEAVNTFIEERKNGCTGLM